MRIVIAGAGEVGTHLATLLTRDKHDIVLITEDEQTYNSACSREDLLKVSGCPTSISFLKESGVDQCKLFVAVTPDESRNMTSCMLAKKLGAEITVARVDTMEYMEEENQQFFRDKGISSLIYPELLVANEINHLITRPWARHWWEMQCGKLLLFAVVVREDCELIGKAISEISGPEDPYHITAIKRNGKTIIPHGKTQILLEDLVFVMTGPENVNFVRRIFDKENIREAKRVVYMGANDITIRSINSLPKQISAFVVDQNLEKLRRAESVVHHPHCTYYHADARDLSFFYDEGIRHADVFVAATERTESNIIASLSAKRLMNFAKTITMVEQTSYLELAEKVDVGSIINKKAFAAAHIYRMLLQLNVDSIKSFTVADADVLEYRVKHDSVFKRKAVKDLNLPSQASIGGYVRGDKGYLANGNTVFQPGDVLLIFCLHSDTHKLKDFLL